MIKRQLLQTLAGVFLLGCSGPATLSAQATSPATSEQDAYEIGLEAYIYLYPLITMDVTRRQATNIEAGKIVGFGPLNTFSHLRAYPDATYRAVVRPNFDTLYSIAWLDLTRGPVVVTVPNTHGRFYLLPILDMWTDVFAVPGKRTSGTEAAAYAVLPPGWRGNLPRGLQPIQAPTPYVWIVGRTQTNGPADYAAVHQVQDGFTVTPLASWGKGAQPVAVQVDSTVDMKTPPLEQVNALEADKYFAYGAKLMKVNPPHPSDWSILARLKRVGIAPGVSFDLGKLDPATRTGLQRAARDGLKLMQSKISTMARVTNGWQMNTETMGVYGNAYLKRAIIALAGLGANQPDDAIYPLLVSDADGQPAQGGKRYVIHFAKDSLPPAQAFWSLTMYDADGFQVANPLNRFAIGDRDSLRYNSDGSLDLYIQHDSPGAEKESNWLPAPAAGTLGLTMRLYAPAASALDGRWNPPAVKRVE